MDPTREQQLLDRLQQGDPVAFDELYAHYRPRLYGFLLRMSQRREVAEDLLQETWIRLVGTAPALREGTRFGAWLFTVARNLFLSYQRARLLDDDRVGELGRLAFAPADPGSPFAAAASSELEAQLERALAALPIKYREALLLVAVEGLEPREAAAVCAISPEAFRQRLSRARALLAEEVSP
jgi:RNA polymerase sigma factor (sigma-70 family)